MGGITGLAFTSHDCSEIVDNMAARMPYRAVNGMSKGCVAGASFVGLYRRPNFDYPEQSPPLEVAPLVLVTCDCRIDNREQLISHFGLETASDHELIYRSWLEWGSSFPVKLLGDFSFAIYDGRTNKLVLGRDPVGVKPLFYAWTELGLAFASEIAPISNCLSMRRFNSRNIKDFLLGHATSSDETMVQGVFRVPPGKVIEVAADRRSSVSCYWNPYSIEVTSETSATKLWALLTEAVRVRSKNTGPVGYACSGGLDSTSICYAAPSSKPDRTLPLRTFSIVFDSFPSESERAYIEAALHGLPADPTFVDMSGYDPLEELSDHLNEQSRLFHAPGLVMNGKLYRAVQASGCTVFIDGHGGDEVVSHGFQRLVELALEKRWLELWRSAAAASVTLDESRMRVFLAYWLRYGFNKAPRLRARLIRSLTLQDASDDIIGPELSDVQSAPDPKADVPNSARSTNYHHVTKIFNHNVVEGLEILELAAARRGIELRFPFLDRPLIEYALSLPESSKLQGRWTRAILREAMAGVVPETVRLRTEKFDFTSHLARGILSSQRESVTDALKSNCLGRLVNLARLERSWIALENSGPKAKNSETLAVWRAITLYKWISGSQRGN